MSAGEAGGAPPFQNGTAPPWRALCVIDAHDPRGADPQPRQILLEALAERGFSVHVICPSPDEVARSAVHHRVVFHLVPPMGDFPAQARAAYPGIDRLVGFDVLDANDLGDDLLVGPATKRCSLDELAHLVAENAPNGASGGGPLRRRAPRQLAPRLGIILDARSKPYAAERALRSVLAHTEIPFRVIVTAEETSSWRPGPDGTHDERVQVVAAPQAAGATRNLALSHLVGDEDLVVFLSPEVEVLADWWAGFLAIFDTDVEAGVVGEHGRTLAWPETGPELADEGGRGARPCAALGPACVTVRRETLARAGRFDVRLEADAQLLDLCLRAARIGARIWAAGTGLVLDLDPDLPEAFSARDRKLLSAKRARQARRATSPFLLLADATEVLEDPALLSAYGAAFTAQDEVALVAFAVGRDPERFSEEIAAVAGRLAFDLETGPRVIALLPPTAAEDEMRAIGEEVHALLTARPPADAFAELACIAPQRDGALRDLAARFWRARADASAASA